MKSKLIVPLALLCLTRIRADQSVPTNETSDDPFDDDDDDDDYYDDDDDDMSKFQLCDMECENGGTCELLQLMSQHRYTLRQHCICPEGYGGVLCEREVDLCFTDNNNPRYCQNEAPCRILDGMAQCNCKEAYTVSAFAGNDCSYPASEYCTRSGRKSFKAFCANGGSCKTYVGREDDHPGCDCERGYSGDHCEYRDGADSVRVASESDSSSSSSSAYIFFAVALILIYVFSLGVLFVLIRRWRIRTLAERQIVEQANFVTSELTMRCMRESTFNDADTVPLAPGQESKELNEGISDLML